MLLLMMMMMMMMMMLLCVHSQLYGEADPDQDVSPDTEDPEAAGSSDVKFVSFPNSHFAYKI